jgi:peptidoglycan/LPS O-acetylase OafA/YrhL
MASTLRYRPEIDGLRAIAVIAVVAYHAFPEVLGGGFVGVDIFFVISGYLITGIVLSEIDVGNFSLRSFYARRIRRILPALLVVLVTTAIVGWHLLLPEELAQLGRHVLASALFASNFVLWSETGYFEPGSSTKVLLHLWSLAVEEQFYVIWPVALLALHRFIGFRFLVALAAAMSFLLCLRLTALDPTAAFYSPIARCWEILAGSMLLLAERDGRLAAFRSWQSALAGLVLLSSAIFFFRDSDPFPGWRAAVPVLGTALIISAGSATWPNRVLSSGPLVAVGLASYPLYLWHWPVLVFARQMQGGALNTAASLCAVMLAVVFAFATYRVCEKPIRKLPSISWVPASLLGSLGIVGGMGLVSDQSAGFADRYSPEAKQIAGFTYDYLEAFRGGECFLDPDQTYANFADCGLSDRTGKPRILLWGDSYVAHLYPGYAAVFGNDYDIVQRTASACPPFLGVVVDDRRHCESINHGVFQLAAREKFDRIVLSTTWDSVDWTEIGKTIDALKSIGAAEIDLVGPVPRWSARMPILMLREFVRTGQVPYRMSYGLTETMQKLDPLMAQFARLKGVNYISPAHSICTENGCITMAMIGHPDTIVSYDVGHLTSAGSVALVSTFRDQILR